MIISDAEGRPTVDLTKLEQPCDSLRGSVVHAETIFSYSAAISLKRIADVLERQHRGEPPPIPTQPETAGRG